MKSMHDVVTFLLDMEEQLDLVNLKNKDTYVWPLLRFKLSLRIQQELGIITTPHDALAKDTRVERYRKAFRLDSKLAMYRKKKDTIIVTHDRRVMVEGEERDIYTYPIAQQYPDALMVNRQEYNNLHTKNTGLVVLEESALDQYKREIKKQIANWEELYPLYILSESIHNEFGITIDVNAMLKEEWKHFVKREYRFRQLLKRVQPKQVILVVGYDKYGIISACHKEGVKVIEVQHGIIDAHHLGYHYPLGLPKECFSDELWLFTPYWKLSAKLPDVEIQYIGFSYFHEMAAKVEDVQRKPEQFIFLSQGTCGNELVKQAVLLARSHSECSVIYKLHPGEFAKWKERYPMLLEAPDNLEIITNERDLYTMLKESQYCVGAYSTAIYEALALGCIGILVDVEGVHEHMGALIEHELVFVSKNIRDDFEYIVRHKADMKLTNIYF